MSYLLKDGIYLSQKFHSNQDELKKIAHKNLKHFSTILDSHKATYQTHLLYSIVEMNDK